MRGCFKGSTQSFLLPILAFLLPLCVADPPHWVQTLESTGGKGLPSYPLHHENWYKDLEQQLEVEMAPKIAARRAEFRRVSDIHSKLLAESKSKPGVSLSLSSDLLLLADMEAGREGEKAREEEAMGDQRWREEFEAAAEEKAMGARGAALESRRGLSSSARKPVKQLKGRITRRRNRYSDPFVQGLSNAWVTYRSATFGLAGLKDAKRCKKVLLSAANGNGDDALTRARKAYDARKYGEARTETLKAKALGQECERELKSKKMTKSHTYNDVRSALAMLARALQRLGLKTQRGRSAQLSVATPSLISTSNCHVTVSKDGDGDLGSVQEAVNRFSTNSERKTICIRPGVYRERILIPETAQHIHFKGLGRSTSVRITSETRPGESEGPTSAATVIVRGAYFRADSVTFENTFFHVVVPAPAIAVLASFSSFYDCRFLGWMDTIAAIVGNQYYSGCYIEGLCDFIWGSARAIFENSELYAKFVLGYKGYMTAQGSDDFSRGTDGRDGGFIFDRCKLGGNGQAIIGRPYRSTSLVGVFNSFLDANIQPEHWEDWMGNYDRERKVYFLEYNNNGPASVDKASRKLCIDLNESQLDQYTATKFIGGDWL